MDPNKLTHATMLSSSLDIKPRVFRAAPDELNVLLQFLETAVT